MKILSTTKAINKSAWKTQKSKIDMESQFVGSMSPERRAPMCADGSVFLTCRVEDRVYGRAVALVVLFSIADVTGLIEVCAPGLEAAADCKSIVASVPLMPEVVAFSGCSGRCIFP